MNLIKRHGGLALVGGLTLILIIIIFIIFSKMIFTTSDSVYGNRLENFVEIDKKVTNAIIKDTSSLAEVEEIEIRTQGKIVYTTILFKKGTKLDKAKSIAENLLTKYDEEVVGYYDFGYFLKEVVDEDAEETGFLIAGTKHPKVEKVSWTKVPAGDL